MRIQHGDGLRLLFSKLFQLRVVDAFTSRFDVAALAALMLRTVCCFTWSFAGNVVALVVFNINMSLLCLQGVANWRVWS